MLHRLRTYLEKRSTYFALEISETGGKESLYLIKLKKNDNELVIAQNMVMERLDELPFLLKKNQPLFLCINTSKILTKKVEGTPNKNPEAIINTAFPNLELNSFYYEVIPQKSDCIISIVKKECMDGLLAQLRELKIIPYRISLGISSIRSALPYLERDTISVSNRKLALEDGAIKTISSIAIQEEHLYRFNGLNLPNGFLLPFSSLLDHLSKVDYITNFEGICKNLQWELKNLRIFNQTLKFALIFFVVLLLVNFLVYDSYREKVSDLSTAMAANSSQKKELALLGNILKKKQERVETLNKTSNSRATYYLDLLARRIPKSILLNQINYQPLFKPIRDAKPIELGERTILVSGISKNTDHFSSWIAQLEQCEWIERVETLDYDYITKGSSNFELEIKFYEDQHEK
ncbi:MAG: hypothetical protein AAFX53_06285 [Bacteroidota bacterium]